MKILSVSHALPSLRLSNADVIDRLCAANRDHFGADDLTRLAALARRGLETAGNPDTRYALGEGEHALAFALDAARRALAAARVDPAEIDFVTYGGVGRAFIEPDSHSTAPSPISSAGRSASRSVRAPRRACTP